MQYTKWVMLASIASLLAMEHLHQQEGGRPKCLTVIAGRKTATS